MKILLAFIYWTVILLLIYYYAEINNYIIRKWEKHCFRSKTRELVPDKETIKKFKKLEKMKNNLWNKGYKIDAEALSISEYQKEIWREFEEKNTRLKGKYLTYNPTTSKIIILSIKK